MQTSSENADTYGLDTCGDPDLIQIVHAAAEWQRAVEQRMSPRWLSILGTSGTGKTHVAKRLWSWVQSSCNWNPPSCAYCPRIIHWPSLIEDLRDGLRNGEARDMRQWPFLVLDDIAGERITEMAGEKLSTLLGARERRWTILTSNVGLGALAEVDNRIADRLMRDNGLVVEVRTVSYSVRQKRNPTQNGESI